MKDYQPVDISAECNTVSDEILSSDPIPQPNNSNTIDVNETGLVLMKGLPFNVGNSKGSSKEKFLTIGSNLYLPGPKK